MGAEWRSFGVREVNGYLPVTLVDLPSREAKCATYEHDRAADWRYSAPTWFSASRVKVNCVPAARAIGCPSTLVN